MRQLAIALLATLALGSTQTGCMRAYTVTMGDQAPEDAHYVIVQTRKNGKMRVYDCVSYPDDEWRPSCVRARMRAWAGGRGDAPEELVDE